MPAKYSLEEAKKRIYAYCAYRERCHMEVREKLFSWGLYTSQVEELTASLISGNFLNEERFARSFASGKFRLKQWGRRKIVTGLRERQINAKLIEMALTEIEDEDYTATIKSLIQKKQRELDRPGVIDPHGKLARYVIGKGFEPELVWPHVKAQK